MEMDHPIIITFLILAIIAFMYFAAEVLKPLALAILLSFALAPLVRLMQRRMRMPKVPAVVLTVLVSLGLLGGICAVVWGQLSGLAEDLPRYQRNIQAHLSSVLKPGTESTAKRLGDAVEQVTTPLTADPEELARRPMAVEVIARPTFQERLESAVGPYVEPFAVGSFVLILVLFILMRSEDLSDRLIELFGHGQISLTTRTMEEVASRISRYLATFALVNSSFGLIIGVGLWAIGVPYAVLWGFLAGALRFIPYVGPISAFGLAFVFSLASFGGWREPLMVLALFGIMEVAANSFLEPIIYGKTTGLSALGLLVAAMFWTWLWGALGLLLSTPLTVCLAVLGKYVPSLGAFATLLGEESELAADVRFYQRLLTFDQDGATDIVENALADRPRAEVFDGILVPALSRAETDLKRGQIESREAEFLWRVAGDLLDDQEQSPELSLSTVTPTDPTARTRIVGVAVADRSDELALRMLRLAVEPLGHTIEVVGIDARPTLDTIETILQHEPDVVVLSHIPPGGLTATRYLLRRLKARQADLRIVVGNWTAAEDTAREDALLRDAGAAAVFHKIAEARDALQAGKLTAPVATALTPA
jgi:predicted PurR-regulated permease PerM/methylmalonyl-CoA mutase cobalamin-binding subunit